MRNRLLAVLLLIVPAWGMRPWQNQILAERRQLKYGGAPVTREMRDQIGQGLAIALLAGFRGVAADFIWLRAQGFWEQRQWFKQSECIENAVKLQPQSVFFWDVGAWHMAWNIAYAERIAPDNATLAEGIRRERLWHDRGREFLERGLQNIPNRFDLYYKLGWIYYQHLARDCGGETDCQQTRYRKAAEYFLIATTYRGAPDYLGRDAARCLEKAGDLPAAYQLWRKLWQENDPHRNAYARPIIQREIRRFENLLDIPADGRIFPPKPIAP